MKPKYHSYFRVDVLVLDLDYIILILLKRDWVDPLEDTSWLNLDLANHVYWDMLLLCKRLRKIDFSPLCLPKLSYAAQHHILTAMVDLASFCLLHYGGKISMLI